MLKIVAERTAGLTRVFHDNVELKGIESIVIDPIVRGQPIKATIVFLDVQAFVDVQDENVDGLPDKPTASSVRPVEAAKPPTIVRGKMPLKIEVGSAEAELMRENATVPVVPVAEAKKASL
jgi:hypothetical protein